MLTEKNFADALVLMNFTRRGDRYEKIFAEGVVMGADLREGKLSYPAQIKGRDHNTACDESHRENLVVFECVNRLLDKGYKPEDIELERTWKLGHTPKGGRADICVSSGGKVLFIVECKTAGTEYKRERDNMLSDGGQLFSYWQQEQSCQWLVLYASDFSDGKLKPSISSVPCGEKFYRDAPTVPERFKIWRERYEQKFLDDVIFHDETVAYKIGVKPFRKRDLEDFEDVSLVNQFEEILRHNQVSDKENAFNRLLVLFICKLVDESRTKADEELTFQFKAGVDTHETFQDKLQRLYRDGMEKFMGEDIFYLPENYPDRLFENFRDEENHDEQIRDLRENFRKLKFYTNNAFAFVEVNNEKLFYINAKILKEVVDILCPYRIIGSTKLQTLGDLFEQLLDKGFKQDAGQFFTPTPIAQFIWDSLPLDALTFRDEKGEPPKIIDYACGAGHFLTEGFRAVNDCFARHGIAPPILWERDKLFGVEKDYRLARVSKISLFMHGAGDGKIKFGDGLKNYPDENIAPDSFDVLVANPPYSVKAFKMFLSLTNDEFSVLDKISNTGSEIETLFTERIGQLVKSRGVAAVILPSSILNKDAKSFITARESVLKKFFVRAIVQLGSRTFSATGTKTVILFLERFDEPPRRIADYMDVAETIVTGRPLGRNFSRDIFAAYLKKIGVSADDYRKFIGRDENFITVPYFAEYAAKLPNDRKFRDRVIATEREKIFFFGLTYRQTTLIVNAPDGKEEETFLGYSWSNAKGREGIVHNKKRGGLLYEDHNRTATDRIAAVIRAAFAGQQLHGHPLQKYFHYATLADLLDFDAVNFNKKFTLTELTTKELTTGRNFQTTRLGNVVEINSATLDPTKTPEKIFHYVDIGSVDSATSKIDFSTRVTGATAPSRARRLANDGDVLISTVRPYLKSFAQVKDAPQDTLYSTGFAVLSTKDPDVITNDFIFRLFMDDALLMEQMKAKMSKGSYPSINQGDLQSFYLPLPPLEVQRQIVAEFNALDAQISQADETILRLDADIQNKFTALFDGKNFETRTIDNLFDLQIGKTPARNNPDYWNNGIHKWISVGDLGKYDRFTGDTAEKISQAAVDETGIKLVPPHTVIMSFKLTIGRTAITSEEIYTNEATVAFLSKTKYLINAEYLRIYLQRHDWSRGQMNAVKGPTLNKQSIGRSAIPVPPIELQEEFAEYVRNCERLKGRARQRREELTGERAKLVTKYFR